jgi:ABC-type microcin C transport system permease subunit YejE
MKKAKQKIQLSYWSKTWSHYRRSILNITGLSVILFLIAIALTAPFLAGSTPLYVQHQDKIYFPVIKEIWPLSKLNLYPELRNAPYLTWHRAGSTVLYPPVPFSPSDYELSEIWKPPVLNTF